MHFAVALRLSTEGAVVRKKKREENLSGAFSPFYQQRDLRALLHPQALARMQPPQAKDAPVYSENGPVDALSCSANVFTYRTFARRGFPRHRLRKPFRGTRDMDLLLDGSHRLLNSSELHAHQFGSGSQTIM